MTTEVLGIRF